MKVLRHFNLRNAFADLRGFLSRRQQHQYVFFALALGLTVITLVGFYIDSAATPAYKPPDIVWAKLLKQERTVAEIVAQQKIDQAQKDKDDAEMAAALEKRRQSFKKVDDALKKWGI